MNYRITIIALPGVLASAVTGPLDVFTTANVLANRNIFETSVRSPTTETIRSSSGLQLKMPRGLPRASQHVIIVAALGINQSTRVIDSILQRLNKQTRLFTWLKAQYDGGALLAANCTGTFLLAEAGFLKGRLATTTWWLTNEFSQRYPTIQLDTNALMTESKRVICGGAAMSHLDLALYLVERFTDSQLARQCARYLVIDHNRELPKLQLIPEHSRSDHPVVQTAMRRLKADYSAPIAELATELGVTQRTLNRLFQRTLGCTAQSYRQRVRIDRACRLLETKPLRIEDVAIAVGYTEPSAFYRAFFKNLGIAPRDYQYRYGPSSRSISPKTLPHQTSDR